MNRRFPLFELLLVAVLLITLVACGGGHRSAVTSGVGSNTVTPQDGITKGTFRLVPQGDLDTESFSISIKELGSGDIQVDVDANSAKDLPYALFELIYDAANYNPTSVEFSDFFGSDVLTAGITTKAGNVGLAVVPINYDVKPGVSGTGNVFSVRFENAPNRTISAPGPPSDYRDLTLTLTGTGGTEPEFTGATWPMILIGDGDISGEVGVPDITPIATGFLAKPSGTGNENLFVVDYDGDDEIGIPDITPIATQYLESVAGYNVYYDTVGTFDPATATLDGTVAVDTMIANGVFEPNGFLQFNYTFTTLPPDGDAWYYFAVPYAIVNETPTEAGPAFASAGLLVESGGILPGQPRIDAFTIGVVGEGVDDQYLSGTTPYSPTFIANESYTFGVVSAEVAFWNDVTLAYDPPINIDDTHADWNPAWVTGIAWNTTATGGAFSFDSATGNTTGTVGPDDPYTFTVTGTLNAASVSKVVTLNVDAVIDPKAPLLAAVVPDEVRVDNIATTDHYLFVSMNDDPAGTDPYTLAWLPVGGGAQIDFTLAAVVDPGSLAAGQFYVEERDDIIHGTTHIIHFRSHYQIGEYRFLATNNIGRQNSINHPPVDGTTPTALTFTVNPAPPFQGNLRTFPITTYDGTSRVVIMPEEPRVQKYPAISFPGSPPDSRYQNYIRDIGDQFVPYLEAVGDPDNMKTAPWVRAYTVDPFPGGNFDADAPFIASTALKETKQFNPGNTAEWVSDWNIREWTRVIIETTSNTIFPAQPNPNDKYHLVVFGLQNDWDNLVPTGVGDFRKIGGPTPFDDIPEIVGIANADLAFDTERDGVAPFTSDWPLLEYPSLAGVEFDWSDLSRRDGYALFILADYIRPDVFFGTVGGAATPYRDTSIVLYDDSNGSNELGRTVNNHTVGSEVYLSTVKPYEFDTNGGTTPNMPPGVGDPPTVFNDNDTGWMICPIAEIDRFDILLEFYQTFYVGVSIWNFQTRTWVNSPVPLEHPFTITNYVP